MEYLFFTYNYLKNFFSNYNIYEFCMFPYRFISYEYFRNDNIDFIDKKNMILTYKYNQNEYKILIKHHTGPNNILYVTNHIDEDITEEFEKILGPGNDFHNIDYDPSFFNAEFIKIHYINGKCKFIFTDEIIKI